MFAALIGVPRTASAQSLTVVEEDRIAAPTTQAGDRFGLSVGVASDGSRAVVGAFLRNVGADTGRGEAYVMVRASDGTWTIEQTLPAMGAAAGDHVARSVAISGDGLRVAVGADLHAGGRGGVWMYVRSGTTWTLETRLTPSRSALSDTFGSSLALDATGTSVVVGAALLENGATANVGGAFVFRRGGGGWSEEAVLLAVDGSADDAIGESVAVSAAGDRAILGGGGVDAGATDCGGAVVFRRVGASWEQEARLLASDRTASERAGQFVALSGDGSVAAISVRLDTVSGLANAGSVRTFARTGSAWGSERTVTAGTSQAGALFGGFVSLSRDGARMLVAADGEDDGIGLDVGAIYLFEIAGPAAPLSRRHARSLRAAGERFGNGSALAADGSIAVVGSSFASFATGLRIGLDDGTRCAEAGACSSRHCVDGVCCATACGGGTDDCQACSAASGGSMDGACTPRSATTVCRAASGACDVEESCDGVSASCPTDAQRADATPCPDSNRCNGEEECAGGVCAAAGPLVCEDGNACTVDGCEASTGCTFVGSCADANALDGGDGAADAGLADADTIDASTMDATSVLDASSDDAATADASESHDASTHGVDAASDVGARDATAAMEDGGTGFDAAQGPERIPLRCACDAAAPTRTPALLWVVVALIVALAARRRSAQFLRTAVVAAWIVGTAAPAAAQATTAQPTAATAQDASEREREAQVRYQLGTVHYGAGRFAAAAEEFERAHALSGRDALLYNAYLAWREAGDTFHAAAALRRFLAGTADLEPERRQHLERRLAALDAAVAAGAAPAAEPEREPLADASAPASIEPEALPIAPLAPMASTEGEGLSVVPGIVAISLGAGALIAAGISGLVALDIAAAHDSTCSGGSSGTRCPVGYDQGPVVERFELHRDVAWGLFGGGLAVLASGAILLAIGATDDPPVAIACGPDGCSVHGGRRF